MMENALAHLAKNEREHPEIRGARDFIFYIFYLRYHLG